MPDEKLGPDGKPINTGNILSDVSEEDLQKQILEQKADESGEFVGGKQTDVDSWDKPPVDEQQYEEAVTTQTVPDYDKDYDESGPGVDPNSSNIPGEEDEQSWGEWLGEKAKDVTRYAVNQGNIFKDIMNKPRVKKFRSDFKSGFKGNPRGYRDGGPVKAKGRYGGNVPGMKHGGMKK